MQFNYNQYLPIQSSAYLNNNNLFWQKTQTDVTPINELGLTGLYGISIPEVKEFFKKYKTIPILPSIPKF